MVSSEVQRTLVKSPPELWAELSDPAALARHLGELGDIHITSTQPETTIQWEGEKLAGTVTIQPSGWGTKVTLTVVRAEARGADEPAAEAGVATDAEPASEVGGAADAEPAAEAEPAPPAELAAARGETEQGQAVPEPAAELPADTAPAAAEAAACAPAAAEPRRGFFARLFGRRRKSAAQPHPGQPDAFAAVTQALAPESFVATDVFAQPSASPPSPLAEATAGVGDMSAELKAAEEVPLEAVAAEDATDVEPTAQESAADKPAAGESAGEGMTPEEIAAVLTGVLDRLGAAHHRPFSRA